MTRQVVTICDRCGKQVTSDIRVVAYGLGGLHPHNHLCIECCKAFDAWLRVNE